VYHPGVVVHHKKGSSAKTVPLRMAYHWHRSLFLYHRKNIAPRYSSFTNAGVYAGIWAGFAARVGVLVAKRLLAPASTAPLHGLRADALAEPKS